MKGIKVWECKIVVSGDTVLPNGFDSPLRRAVIAAVEEAGIEVLGCSSGWGGSLTALERSTFEEQNTNGTYYAGLVDCEPGGQIMKDGGRGMTTRHTDEHPIERLSALPALLVVVSLALVATGIGATIQWARTAPPARVLTVTGVNGPGVSLLRDQLRCRVWGRLVVCASNDVSWRVEP